MLNIVNIYSSIKKTFYYEVLITKNTNNNNAYLQYNNLLFDITIDEKKVLLKTKYLSPCMFIQNTIRPYVMDNDKNYTIVEYGEYTDKSELNIKFDANNSKIPIDYFLITKLFAFLKKNDHFLKYSNIKKIDIKQKNENEIDTSFYENEKNKLTNIKYSDCWKNFNLNANFKIHHKEWITSDLGIGRYKEQQSISDFTQKIFDKINNYIDANNLKLLGNKKNKISGIANYYGGINLTKILDCFGHSNISKNAYSNIICSNSWNEYYVSNTDIQTLVVFNEFLKVEGIKTTLMYDGKIDTTKKEDILFISEDNMIYPIIENINNYFKKCNIFRF
jgi:hypothetical protein